MRFIPIFTDAEFKSYIKKADIAFSDMHELLKNKFTKSELHNILNFQTRDEIKRAEVMRILLVNLYAKNDETLNKEIKELYQTYYRFGLNYKNIAEKFFLSDIRAFEYVSKPEEIKTRYMKIQIINFMRNSLEKIGVLA